MRFNIRVDDEKLLLFKVFFSSLCDNRDYDCDDILNSFKKITNVKRIEIQSNKEKICKMLFRFAKNSPRNRHFGWTQKMHLVDVSVLSQKARVEGKGCCCNHAANQWAACLRHEIVIKCLKWICTMTLQYLMLNSSGIVSLLESQPELHENIILQARIFTIQSSVHH